MFKFSCLVLSMMFVFSCQHNSAASIEKSDKIDLETECYRAISFDEKKCGGRYKTRTKTTGYPHRG